MTKRRKARTWWCCRNTMFTEGHFFETKEEAQEFMDGYLDDIDGPLYELIKVVEVLPAKKKSKGKVGR